MTDYDAMTATELVGHLAAMARAAGKDRHDTSMIRLGVAKVLTLLDGRPGASWQHRWVAADADRTAITMLHVPASGDARHHRAQFRKGLAILVGAGVIRPGLPFALDPFGARLVLAGLAPRHGEDIQRVVESCAATVQMNKVSVRQVQHACAAMISYTGLPLSLITPREWASAQQYRLDASQAHKAWTRATQALQPGDPEPVRHPDAAPIASLVGLASAYGAALRAGLMQPEPTPGPGLSALPPTLARAAATAVTVASMLDRHAGDVPPAVRALLRDAWSIESGAVDNSTLARNMTDINSFMRVVCQVIPGHDSLHVPIEHRDLVLRTLRTMPVKGRKPGTPRASTGHMLGRIRGTYRMAEGVVARHGLHQHDRAVGAFPWPASVIAKINKVELAHRHARMTASVREHIGHLDGLVAAAAARLARADSLVVAATAADPGATFTHDGAEYRRAKGGSLPDLGNGRAPLSVYRAGGRRSFDAHQLAYRAAQAYVLTVLLRETGLRIEEVAELTLRSFSTAVDGDFTFPVVHVAPSKQERSRTIALPVPLLQAVSDLVLRTRKVWGCSPLAARTDHHEGTEQPPALLLFFTHRNRTFMGPDITTFATWLNDVVEEYNERHHDGLPLAPVRPHQMRRLFATDLAERGADILVIQETLGHANVATTSIYVKTDVARSIAEVVKARNREWITENGAPCDHCQGLGYLPDTTDNTPHRHDDPTA